MLMFKVVLLRQGENAWNMEDRFDGWTNADLSERGFVEARRGYVFDADFRSVLKRTVRTMWSHSMKWT
jgi:2,3-bisphosphoglycerate-dependent phosphoglycerate mutase